MAPGTAPTKSWFGRPASRGELAIFTHVQNTLAVAEVNLVRPRPNAGHEPPCDWEPDRNSRRAAAPPPQVGSR